MQLDSFKLERNEYGDNKGLFTGTVKYKNQYQNTTLTLDPEISTKVVEVIAGVIAAAAKKVADQVAADLHNAVADNSPTLTLTDEKFDS